MALERRLAAGLGAKAQATVRRWLSKIAADLCRILLVPAAHGFWRGLPRR